MQYYSQAGQDKWVHDTIGDKGVFIEIGAYDGVQTSNTLALEQSGWKGICIEANEWQFRQLSSNRECIVIQRAVTDYKGVIGFNHDRIGGNDLVKCDTLNNILTNTFCPKRIDYLSLDVEGHELTILSAFDLKKWDVKLMTVEHNLYCDGPEKKEKLFELLTGKGYKRIFEDVKCLDPNPLYFNQPFEDWYAKDNFLK